jgi:hypothetical protein
MGFVYRSTQPDAPIFKADKDLDGNTKNYRDQGQKKENICP